MASQASGAITVPTPDPTAHILTNLIASLTLTYSVIIGSVHLCLLDFPNHGVLVYLSLTASVHVLRVLSQNGSGLWKVPRSTWESARS